ncbi:hypothetical protein ACS0TY_007684 [Phlomoides rotata]
MDIQDGGVICISLITGGNDHTSCHILFSGLHYHICYTPLRMTESFLVIANGIAVAYSFVQILRSMC